MTETFKFAKGAFVNEYLCEKRVEAAERTGQISRNAFQKWARRQEDPVCRGLGTRSRFDSDTLI